MPLYCPYCGKEVESHNSYAGTKDAVRSHIRSAHPDKKIPGGL